MMGHAFIPLIFAILFWHTSPTTTELFTSSADLQRLTYAEKEIPQLIQNYIQLESERLDHLKRFAFAFSSAFGTLAFSIHTALPPNTVKAMSSYKQTCKVSPTQSTLFA